MVSSVSCSAPSLLADKALHLLNLILQNIATSQIIENVTKHLTTKEQ